jgi:hypothetical protein
MMDSPNFCLNWVYGSLVSKSLTLRHDGERNSKDFKARIVTTSRFIAGPAKLCAEAKTLRRRGQCDMNT